MQQGSERGQLVNDVEAASNDEAVTAGTTLTELSTGPTDVTSVADPGLQHAAATVATDIPWRTLPALGNALVRMLVAVALGAATGIIWGLLGHTLPAHFPQAYGWTLALCTVPLLTAVVGLLADSDMRAVLARRPVRPPLVEMGAALVLLVICTAGAAVSDITVLAAPATLILTVGASLGFGLGGMRLRRMNGDVRWFFVGLGVLGLFGLVLTFLLPAAFAPLANGQQGLFGCLLFVLGIPNVALGAVAGGWQRMRVERAAFGMPPALEDTLPFELERDHWSRQPTPEPHPLDLPIAESEEHDMDMTQPLTTADAVIEELTARRQALLESIVGLSDDQLDRKGIVGDWSIKNAVAHLVAWEEVVVRITPERARTRVKPAELQEINADEDGYNARVVASREALTPQEQLVQFAEARAKLIALIQALGDEALARSNPWPEWQGTLGAYFIAAVGDHESEHAEAIAAGAEALRTEG